ncbi:hypothetical protein A6M21_01600 [Desulfotomaculum copahuensis]|uniref:Anti-sigma-W factor RsiW n=2 Tax=Desulfotomaculum copahuensis TaxID=1838280 RepID=A0A1B7LAS1_9FIRM|nr:hypothetical protein A6M21_01600 [Desulfotomaculum copahuensis]
MFSACLDGELSPSKEARVKTHLISCAACRARWEELQSTMELVRSLPELSPPPEFRSQVKQKLAMLPAPANTLPARAGFLSRLVRRHGLISAAAAMLLVLGTASLLWSGDLAGRLGTGHNPVRRNSQVADVNQGGIASSKAEKSGLPAAGRKKEPFSPNSTVRDGNIPVPFGGGRADGNNVKTNQTQVDNTAPVPPAQKGNDQKTTFMALSLQPRAHLSGNDPGSRGTEPAGMRLVPGGSGTDPVRKNAPSGADCGNTGGQTGTAALSDSTGLSRPAKTVRQAGVTLQAGDREQVQKGIGLLAQRYNGMINPDPGGSIFTVVLPVDALEPFLAGLADLGRVSEEKIEGRDVSKDYYEAVDRLSVLQNELTGQQATGAGSAFNTADAQTAGVDNRILQREINCLKGKIQSLDDAVSRATVKITLD